MTVQEMIDHLHTHDPESIVMLRDVVAYADVSFVSMRVITEDDADNHADCEGRVGERIAVIG